MEIGALCLVCPLQSCQVTLDIFSVVPLKVNVALGNIQGNLTALPLVTMSVNCNGQWPWLCRSRTVYDGVYQHCVCRCSSTCRCHIISGQRVDFFIDNYIWRSFDTNIYVSLYCFVLFWRAAGSCQNGCTNWRIENLETKSVLNQWLIFKSKLSILNTRKLHDKFRDLVGHFILSHVVAGGDQKS